MTERKFSIPEAAQELRVSTQWINQRIKSREIGHLRIGKRVFIPESALKEYLEEYYQNYL